MYSALLFMIFSTSSTFANLSDSMDHNNSFPNLTTVQYSTSVILTSINPIHSKATTDQTKKLNTAKLPKRNETGSLNSTNTKILHGVNVNSLLDESRNMSTNDTAQYSNHLTVSVENKIQTMNQTSGVTTSAKDSEQSTHDVTISPESKIQITNQTLDVTTLNYSVVATSPIGDPNILLKIHKTITRSKDAVWATVTLTFMCIILLLAVAQSKMWKDYRMPESQGVPLPDFNEKVLFKDVMEHKLKSLKRIFKKQKKKKKTTEMKSLLDPCDLDDEVDIP